MLVCGTWSLIRAMYLMGPMKLRGWGVGSRVKDVPSGPLKSSGLRILNRV